MTFADLLSQISPSLPEMAVLQLPMVLSEETKTAILTSGKTPADIAALFNSVFDVIDHGSVETVDSLVNKALNN